MKRIKLILISGISFLIFIVGVIPASGQSFSLSVTPPITEIVVMPGTEVAQTYQISNSGEEGLYSIHLFPFTPGGNNGEIDINEEDDIATNPQGTNLFTILEPQVAFGEKFNLPKNSTTTVLIKIKVPPQTAQRDYYYTVIFQKESLEGINQSVSQTLGRIGSNLLISVAGNENPYKLAEIKEFSAPLIVDSLTKINYSLILKNSARTFFKPIGKISVRNIFSKKETDLQIAPQNVLSYSERNMSCLKEEELIDCTFDAPVTLGLYKAELSFSLDGQDKIYQSEVVTIALPFSLIAVLSVIFVIFKIITKKVNSTNK